MKGQYPYQFLLEQTQIADTVLARYRSIQSECRASGKKFVDQDFDSSLPSSNTFNDDNGADKVYFEYLEDVYQGDIFENISSDGILQGNYSDCFLISILIPLCNDIDTIKSLFVDKDLSCGCCCLKFNFIGRPYYVIIDTKVPFVKSHPKFAHPRNSSDSVWFCLVEKAYAKLMGGWSHIGGNPSDAMNNLFGVYNKSLKVKEISSPVQYIASISAQTKFIFLSTFKTKIPEKNSLFSNHSYVFIGFVRENGKSFIHLRDPHGNSQAKDTANVIFKQHGHLLVSESLLSDCFESLSFGIFTPSSWVTKSFELDISPGELDGRFFTGNGPLVAPLPQWLVTFNDPRSTFRFYCIASSKSDNAIGFCMCQNSGHRVSYQPVDSIEIKSAINGSSIIDEFRPRVTGHPYTLCVCRKVRAPNPVHFYCRLECESKFDLERIPDLDFSRMKRVSIDHLLSKASRASPQWYINVDKSGTIFYKISKTQKSGPYTIFFFCSKKKAKGRCPLSGPFAHTCPISGDSCDDIYEIDANNLNIIGIGVSTSKKESIDVRFSIDLYFDGEIFIEKIPDETHTGLKSAGITIASNSRTATKAKHKIPEVSDQPSITKVAGKRGKKIGASGLADMYKMMEDL